MQGARPLQCAAATPQQQSSALHNTNHMHALLRSSQLQQQMLPAHRECLHQVGPLKQHIPEAAAHLLRHVLIHLLHNRSTETKENIHAQQPSQHCSRSAKCARNSSIASKHTRRQGSGKTRLGCCCTSEAKWVRVLFALCSMTQLPLALLQAPACLQVAAMAPTTQPGHQTAVPTTQAEHQASHLISNLYVNRQLLVVLQL
jgi:hypothetical protein